MKKIYISLPISHYDLEERRAYAQRVEDALGHFYEVVNPLKNGLPAEADWREHMRVDLRNLIECDAICLCDNYRESFGCHLELKTSSICGLEICDMSEKQFCSYENVDIHSERFMSLNDLKNESWKDVVGWEGFYKVSNYGRVKSLKRVILQGNGRSKRIRERILVQTVNDNGYCLVGLISPDRKRKQAKVHRLVAEAFLDNPKHLHCINHIDEIKTNNMLFNLEWCSYSYNLSYMNGGVIRSISRRKNQKALR